MQRHGKDSVVVRCTLVLHSLGYLASLWINVDCILGCSSKFAWQYGKFGLISVEVMCISEKLEQK